MTYDPYRDMTLVSLLTFALVYILGRNLKYFRDENFLVDERKHLSLLFVSGTVGMITMILFSQIF